jgi:hypothetical protein
MYNMDSELLVTLFNDPDEYTPFNTRSIVYVDISNRLAHIVRFLANNVINSLYFTPLKPLEMPLERALTLNGTRSDFLTFLLNEEELMSQLSSDMGTKFNALV